MKEQLKHKLENHFQPIFIEVEDQSHMHSGHASAPDGGNSHFECTVVSKEFIGVPLLKRHRLIYDALTKEMKQIHALALKAYTPQEWRKHNE
jgi:BolA protein